MDTSRPSPDKLAEWILFQCGITTTAPTLSNKNGIAAPVEYTLPKADWDSFDVVDELDGNILSGLAPQKGRK